jgi:hypothetical protein
MCWNTMALAHLRSSYRWIWSISRMMTGRGNWTSWTKPNSWPLWLQLYMDCSKFELDLHNEKHSCILGKECQYFIS